MKKDLAVWYEVMDAQGLESIEFKPGVVKKVNQELEAIEILIGGETLSVKS